MDIQKESNLGHAIKLRPCFPMDGEFYYNVKKITLKTYVEQTWGVWDEEYQRERHKMNFSPEYTKIIQFHGTDIGILAIQEESESMEVHNIEILPEYQNKGIGTHLLVNIIQQAAEKRKSITLQVIKSNLKANKLYQRLGFKVESETETHFRMKFT